MYPSKPKFPHRIAHLNPYLRSGQFTGSPPLENPEFGKDVVRPTDTAQECGAICKDDRLYEPP